MAMREGELDYGRSGWQRTERKVQDAAGSELRADSDEDENENKTTKSHLSLYRT